MTAPDGPFRIPDHVSTRELDGELVILEMDSGEFFVAQGVGPRVWDLLGEGRTVPEIASLVAERYAQPAEQVGDDVRAFVGELLARKLLAEA